MVSPAEDECPKAGIRVQKLRKRLRDLRERAVASGLSEDDVSAIVAEEAALATNGAVAPGERLLLKWAVIVAALAYAFFRHGVPDLSHDQCLVDSGAVFKEFTRPVLSCDFCREPTRVTELTGMSKEDFLRLGYADKPIVLRGGAAHWKAMKTFSYAFLRDVYRNTSDAFEENRRYCQFLGTATDFEDLEDFFSMPDSRANMSGPDEETWYVGWSNCDQRIVSILREHYTRPDFFPEDSEASIIDWIFIGYAGHGLKTHLDYVLRPSWQAQIRGSKTWTLLPPPECESVCVPSLKVTVRPGDIILVNTNHWYHSTLVEPGEMSITIGSEYD
uniref:Phosphatidylserine specific receptor ptdserr n=1 Tax=Rhipicephalus appendiculatus TaxID=34631 RepID=A0A131YY36_RHIAP